ncbi:MAG: hypothetical protein ACR65O_05430 [Methylomicrobium sp.]
MAQENNQWLKTNGKEPEGWDDTEYVWLHWKNGHIDLTETYGGIDWGCVTHWMPANIIAPDAPQTI